jgi:hypothetical protein
MAPVCSNCGGSEFVWANDIKTGTIGRGGLSLRAGGELSLGTRVCRGCGHADLFLKDPSILRAPHRWRPNEFVPIPTRRPAATTPHATSTTSAPPRPSPAPAPPVAPPSPPSAPAAPAPAAAPPVVVTQSPPPPPATEPEAPAAPPDSADALVTSGPVKQPRSGGTKKARARRIAKPKESEPAPSTET